MLISQNNRDLQLDGLKFILIFLVILGHLHVGFPVGRLIYSFHMPLFVLLSGYFSKTVDNSRLIHWTLKTIFIYAIFIFLNILIDIFVSHKRIACPDMLTYFYKPTLAMWYLLCLIYWRLSLNLFQKMGGSLNSILLLTTVVIAILMGFVPIGHQFSFQRFFAFSPFFIFGVIIREKQWFDIISKISLPVALSFLTIGLFLAIHIRTYMPREPYDSYKDCLVRIIQTANALILCMAFLRLSRLSVVKKFASLGSITLYFYLYHILFVRTMESIYPDFHTNIIEGVALSFFIVFIIWVMSKLKVFRILLLQK